MGGPLTVVVLVAAGGAAEPTTLAIERAVNEALGQAAHIVVREATGTPTDGEALAFGSEADEGAVVEVTWSDRAHRVVTLRVHLAGQRRWSDRTIGFGATDADIERGRAIGFALASMLPDPGVTSTPETATPLVASPQPLAHADEPYVPESPPPDATTQQHSYALDFLGVGVAGLGGRVTGGGAAALAAFITPVLALRVGGAMRGGDIPRLPARTITLLASAGIGLDPWPTTPSRLFGVSFRADYVLMNQTVTHQSESGAELGAMARTVSGLDAVVDGEWRLGADLDLVTGMGLEEMFATTYLDLNGARVATLPPLSVMAEVGLRLRL